MADYNIDWTTANIDGATVIAGVDGPVTVTVLTPDNAGGESFYVQSNDPNDGSAPDVLGAYYPDRPTDGPTSVTIDFDTPVDGVSFQLYDVDTGNGRGTGGWDDKVEIIATLNDGSQVTIQFDNAGNQVVNGNTIEGNGTNTPRGDTVDVSIDGVIDHIEIIYDNGDSHESVGYVGIGNISFDFVGVVCFVRGTLIETNRGEISIEDLAKGDLVRTVDHGMQPIRWIGSTSVAAVGRRAPVLIRKGALGNTSDLLVSPAHRMMLHSWQTELLFDAGEMLVAAQSLVNDSTIIRQEGGTVEYFHILFDTHEIVFANGIPSESFHPGEASVGAMAKQAREEIYALFPQLAESETSYGPSARQTMMPHEAALLSL